MYYTWPNDSFPFRLYLDRPECRIFIIENISHNYDWLKKVKHNIKKTDYFFVYVGWNISDHIAKHNKAVIKELDLDIDNFFIMYNNPDEMGISHEHGFSGDLIPHNTWLDENLFKISKCEKKYDALYTARRTSWKRYELAANIDNLAAAAGGPNHGNVKCSIPLCKNDPSIRLTPEQMVQLMNESWCGLSLSEEEGGSFSTSEYLLCGLPVVSTPSKGGRDYWFNSDNSIIAEPTPIDVKRAVDLVKEKNFNPQIIRRDHIRKARALRQKFIDKLSVIFEEYNIDDIPAHKYFTDNYYHKLRGSSHIDEVIKNFNTFDQ